MEWHDCWIPTEDLGSYDFQDLPVRSLECPIDLNVNFDELEDILEAVLKSTDAVQKIYSGTERSVYVIGNSGLPSMIRICWMEVSFLSEDMEGAAHPSFIPRIFSYEEGLASVLCYLMEQFKKLREYAESHEDCSYVLEISK